MHEYQGRQTERRSLTGWPDRQQQQRWCRIEARSSTPSWLGGKLYCKCMGMGMGMCMGFYAHISWHARTHLMAYSCAFPSISQIFFFSCHVNLMPDWPLCWSFRWDLLTGRPLLSSIFCVFYHFYAYLFSFLFFSFLVLSSFRFPLFMCIIV